VSPDSLTDLLKQEAKRLGFDLVGATPAATPEGFHRLRQWVKSDYAGEMRYLPDRLEAYQHPRHVLDGARSLLMLGMSYRTAEPAQTGLGQGRISRYAWGTADYHDVIHERLRRLRRFFEDLVPGASVRGVVDTAPLLEREFAQLAGLGWIGKNTMLINRQAGSWLFLAALVTDQELTYDSPHESDHCGACRACLDACPTGAFPQPYVLDAKRCVSYLTIELRGMMDTELREHAGDWLFGCDLCQDVCPWNRNPSSSSEPSFFTAADANPVELARLFELSDEKFYDRFRRTPLWRTKRRGILRNAAIVLGNHAEPTSIDALVRGLHDHEPLVRGASAWALGRVQDTRALQSLRERLAVEENPQVREEIENGLSADEG
jgi:epoxyqueuosine reductase